MSSFLITNTALQLDWNPAILQSLVLAFNISSILLSSLGQYWLVYQHRDHQGVICRDDKQITRYDAIVRDCHNTRPDSATFSIDVESLQLIFNRETDKLYIGHIGKDKYSVVFSNFELNFLDNQFSSIKLETDQHVIFDLYAFINFAPVLSNYQHSIQLTPFHLCLSLADSLDGSDEQSLYSSFVFSSGYRTDSQLLSYWLDYCGITPVVVHSKSFRKINNREQCGVDRIVWPDFIQSAAATGNDGCDVRTGTSTATATATATGTVGADMRSKRCKEESAYWMGCQPHESNNYCGNGKLRSTHQNAIRCLVDVLQSLQEHSYYRYVSHQNNSYWGNDTQGDVVNFVSGLGIVDWSALLLESSALEGESDSSWDELLAVIDSISYTKSPNLVLRITSLTGGIIKTLVNAAEFHEAEQDCDLTSIGVIALQADLANQLSTDALHRLLTCSLSLSKDDQSSTITSINHSPVVADILNRIITFCSERESGRRGNRSLLTDCSKRRLLHKFWWRLQLARRIQMRSLSNTLPQRIGKDIRNTVSGSNDSSNELLYPFQAIHVGEGEAHVLIIVEEHHISAAQLLIQMWRENCAIPICQIFMRYSINVVPVLRRTDANADNTTKKCRSNSSNGFRTLSKRHKSPQYEKYCHSDESCYASIHCSPTTPSLRLALLTAESWISSISGPKDIVYLLVGMSSLLLFPQPAIWSEDIPERRHHRGLIPMVAYADFKAYRLPSPMVVHRNSNSNSKPAAASREGGGGAQDFGYDFNAMVGTSFAWQILLRYLREDPSYYLSQSEAEIETALLRFALAHPEFMTIDGQNRHGVFAFEDASNSAQEEEEEEIEMETCQLKATALHDVVDSDRVLRALLPRHLSMPSIPVHSSYSKGNSSRSYGNCVLLHTFELVLIEPIRQQSGQLFASKYDEEHVLATGKRRVEDMTQSDIALIHAYRPVVQYVAHHERFQEVFRMIDQMIERQYQMSELLIDTQVLQQYATQMNSDWNKAQWHLTIEASVSVFRYLQTAATKLPLHSVEETMPFFSGYDYVFMQYPYQITRTVKKAIFYGYRPMLLLQQELEVQIATIEQELCNLTQQSKLLHRDVLARMRFHCFDAEGFLAALYAALASVHELLGVHRDIMDAVSYSLPSQPYEAVREWRAEWQQQRQQLRCEQYLPQKASCALYKTHIVTMGTEMTIGLQNLLFSAYLSNVEVKVLGLGTKYTGYGDKIRLYNSYLQSEVMHENDVVLLIDAYDVLLFPTVKHVAKVLVDSPAPIMFCAEYGHYPEFSVAHAYPFDKDRERDMLGFGPRFMNSGCILGRVGQVRELIRVAHSMATTVDDDQQIFVRYFLSRPDMISIDTTNLFSITGYRESFPQFGPSVHVSNLLELTVVRGERNISSIAVLHCNNIKAHSMCTLVMSQLIAVHQGYFSGADADDLIRALSLHWGGYYTEAAALLLSSTVIQSNSTAEGGVNPISEEIMSAIAAQLE